MPGILDYLNQPEGQGLLALSAGLLQAGGPSRMPISTGQALGTSGMGAMQAIQAAKASQAQQQMLGLHAGLYGAQMQKLMLDAQRQQRVNAILAGETPQGGQPPAPAGPMPAQQASAGPSLMAGSGDVPEWATAGMQQQQPTAPTPAPFGGTVTPEARYRAIGQRLLDAGAIEEGSKFLEAANKVDPETFSPHNVAGPGGVPIIGMVGNRGSIRPTTYNPTSQIPEGMRIGANGDLVAPPGLIPYKKELAEAGRPSVSQNVDMGLSANIKDIVSGSYTGAKGAVKSMDAVNRVRSAVESGNINLGPGADVKQTWDQIATVLGASGADREERLTNTRAAISGLANFGLQSRQLLQGQGSISDFETKLLERAAGGDINKLTAPEIKVVLDVAERGAHIQHAEHKRILGVLQGRPKDAELVPFYQVPDLPASNAGAPAAPKPRNYNPQSGKIE